MKFAKTKTPLAIAVGLMVATSVWAKVPASEAEKLGKELTCVGAIKAGNKEGTIPEFTGKWLGAPAGWDHVQGSGKHPVDIYANEKPLFNITAENMDKYADKLSDGQKAMFKKYPGPHSDIVGSKLYCQLPHAFRRLTRPSSPVIAKASTTCT